MTITKNNLVWMTGPWARFERLQEDLKEITGRHAADYHDAVESLLRERGWHVKREYAVALEGRGGRVDIAAFKNEWRMALELDNRSPRGRSIEKLKLFPADWMTGILLRDPK